MKKKCMAMSFLLIIFLNIASTSFMPAMDNQSEGEILQNQNEVTAISLEQIEELQKIILRMITEIDFSLETIAIYISSNDVVPTDKEHALTHIKELRQGLSIIARTVMMQTDISCVSHSFSIIKSIQNHVKNAVNNKLKSFDKFDIENIVTRSIQIENPEAIKAELIILQKELDSIKQNAEQAGISLGNKVYRNLTDNRLINGIINNNLHYATVWTAFLGTAGIYFWYRFSEDPIGCVDENGNLLQVHTKHGNPVFIDAKGNPTLNPEDNIPLRVKGPKENCSTLSEWLTENLYPRANKKMREILGRTHYSSIDIGEADQTFAQGIARGKLGRLDSFLTAFNTGSVAIGAHFFWPQLSEFYQTRVNPTISRIQKKIFDLHCYGKGGIYYKSNKNKSHLKFSINPRFRFKDIIGCTDAKELGKELIEFINEPEKFQRLGIVPPKGILLHGPPGTGKSYFAEALCGELVDSLKANNKNETEFGFFIIKSTHIQQIGLETILTIIKHHAPCIVFIDEIDLLKLQRDRDSDRLSEALSGLSGFISEDDPKKQVIVIGATNKLENVDEALLRTGRLSKLVYLDYPSLRDRLDFLISSLSDRINPDLFDLAKIARQTSGCTIEDMRLIINSALFRTRINGKPLSQKDLEDALNHEIRKIVNNQELDLSSEEQHVLAIHMAGHAVAHMSLPLPRILATITIKPTNEKMKEESVWHQYYKDKNPGQIYGKIFSYCPHDSIGINNNQILLNECKTLLAGRIAEQLLLGSVSSNNKRTCSGTCKPNAFNTAKQIVLNGINEDQLSKQMIDDVHTRTHALLAELEKEVETLLENQKPLLMFITDMLVEHKTISYDEIMFVIQQMYEKAAKENPELIKEMEELMQKQEQSSATNIEAKNQVTA